MRFFDEDLSVAACGLGACGLLSVESASGWRILMAGWCVSAIVFSYQCVTRPGWSRFHHQVAGPEFQLPLMEGSASRPPFDTGVAPRPAQPGVVDDISCARVRCSGRFDCNPHISLAKHHRDRAHRQPHRHGCHKAHLVFSDAAQRVIGRCVGRAIQPHTVRRHFSTAASFG